MDVTAGSPGTRAVEADRDLAPLRHQFLEALEVLGEAATSVHQALDDAADAFKIVRDHVARDGSLSDFDDVIQPIPLRSAVSTSLDDLERARHRMQRLLFRLMYAEGKSMTEIAHMWGISRQLVSRLLNEADESGVSGVQDSL